MKTLSKLLFVIAFAGVLGAGTSAPAEAQDARERMTAYAVAARSQALQARRCLNDLRIRLERYIAVSTLSPNQDPRDDSLLDAGRGRCYGGGVLEEYDQLETHISLLDRYIGNLDFEAALAVGNGTTVFNNRTIEANLDSIYEGLSEMKSIISRAGFGVYFTYLTQQPQPDVQTARNLEELIIDIRAYVNMVIPKINNFVPYRLELSIVSASQRTTLNPNVVSNPTWAGAYMAYNRKTGYTGYPSQVTSTSVIFNNLPPGRYDLSVRPDDSSRKFSKVRNVDMMDTQPAGDGIKKTVSSTIYYLDY